MTDVKGIVEVVTINGAIFVSDSDEIEKYSPKDNTWEKVKVNKESEDEEFEILAFCSLSKKYLPKNLFNMDNNNK